MNLLRLYNDFKKRYLKFSERNSTIIDERITEIFETEEAEPEIAVTQLRENEEESKMESFETDEAALEKAVTQLIEKEQEERPEIRRQNAYLYNASNFGTMLPGTVD